jgi:hypothetical protein
MHGSLLALLFLSPMMRSAPFAEAQRPQILRVFDTVRATASQPVNRNIVGVQRWVRDGFAAAELDLEVRRSIDAELGSEAIPEPLSEVEAALPVGSKITVLGTEFTVTRQVPIERGVRLRLVEPARAYWVRVPPGGYELMP